LAQRLLWPWTPLGLDYSEAKKCVVSVTFIIKMER
jgi:hypothetical protein